MILLLVQIAWDQAQRLAKRQIEREEGHKDATEDLTDFLSGEKPDFSSSAESTITGGKGMPRVSSVDRVAEWAEQPKEKKLYIVLIRYGTPFPDFFDAFSTCIYMKASYFSFSVFFAACMD